MMIRKKLFVGILCFIFLVFGLSLWLSHHQDSATAQTVCVPNRSLECVTIQVNEAGGTSVIGGAYSFAEVGTYVPEGSLSCPISGVENHTGFGAVCNAANGWVATECAHPAGDGEISLEGKPDWCLTENGCLGDENEDYNSPGSEVPAENIIQVRCCRFR